jgi:hypothetical protein
MGLRSAVLGLRRGRDRGCRGLDGNGLLRQHGPEHPAEVQRQAAADGAQLRLAISPGGPVQRVFDLMALDRLLPVYTSRAQATAPT